MWLHLIPHHSDNTKHVSEMFENNSIKIQSNLSTSNPIAKLKIKKLEPYSDFNGIKLINKNVREGEGVKSPQTVLMSL